MWIVDHTSTRWDISPDRTRDSFSLLRRERRNRHWATGNLGILWQLFRLSKHIHPIPEAHSSGSQALAY
jgi:hypothetical protein